MPKWTNTQTLVHDGISQPIQPIQQTAIKKYKMHQNKQTTQCPLTISDVSRYF